MIGTGGPWFWETLYLHLFVFPEPDIALITLFGVSDLSRKVKGGKGHEQIFFIKTNGKTWDSAFNNTVDSARKKNPFCQSVLQIGMKLKQITPEQGNHITHTPYPQILKKFPRIFRDS